MALPWAKRHLAKDHKCLVVRPNLSGSANVHILLQIVRLPSRTTSVSLTWLFMIGRANVVGILENNGLLLGRRSSQWLSSTVRAFLPQGLQRPGP